MAREQLFPVGSYTKPTLFPIDAEGHDQCTRVLAGGLVAVDLLFGWQRGAKIGFDGGFVVGIFTTTDALRLLRDLFGG